MRRAWVLLAAAMLCGCSSTRHKTEERMRYERHDSVRALFGEELTIRLDDVRIIPPDSVHGRIEARSARVERRRAAVVEAVVGDSLAAERSEVAEPRRAAGGAGWRPPLWSLLAVAAAFYFIGASQRR